MRRPRSGAAVCHQAPLLQPSRLVWPYLPPGKTGRAWPDSCPRHPEEAGELFPEALGRARRSLLRGHQPVLRALHSSRACNRSRATPGQQIGLSW